ncbi:MAG: HEPN domain-containing protein [bacterium]|nr:HEPN domain-containing protein [bacterium]
MNKVEIIKNWLEKAEKDVETANDLFKLKRFDWSLFNQFV